MSAVIHPSTWTAAGVVGRAVGPVAAFLAMLLCAAAAHKFRDRARTAAAVSALAGIEARGAAVTALALVEAAAGLALLLAPTRAAGGWVAAALWGGYFLLLSRAYLAGRRDIDCGCGFGRAHARLGRTQLLRTGALALLAAAVAYRSDALGMPVEPARALAALLAGLALFVLYLAFDTLAGLGARPTGAHR